MARDEVWRRLKSRSGLLFLAAGSLGFASYWWAREGQWWQFAVSVAATAVFAQLAVTEFRSYKPELYVALKGGVLYRESPWASATLPIALTIAALLSKGPILHWGWLDRGDVIGGHQWYRLLSSIFVHDGVLASLNILALVVLGGAYRSQYGWRRMLVVFAGYALAGEALVLATTSQPELGAGGAIYGFVGAALFQAWTAWRIGHARSGAKALRISAVVLLGTLLYPPPPPFVSLAAYVGGLIAGLLVAMAIGVPDGVRRAAAWDERAFWGGEFFYVHSGSLIGFRGPVDVGLTTGFLAPSDVLFPVTGDIHTFMRADEALPESGVVFYKPLGDVPTMPERLPAQVVAAT